MKSAIVCLAFTMAAVQAQPPKLENARVQTRAIHNDLEAQFRSIVAAQSDPAWIGYEAPLVPGHTQWCSENLEGRESAVNQESPKNFYVLVRVAQHKAGKIRTSAANCWIL